MNLPVEAVNEFQEIYQRRLGVEISINEAETRAENFLRLTMLITRKEENENEK